MQTTVGSQSDRPLTSDPGKSAAGDPGDGMCLMIGRDARRHFSSSLPAAIAALWSPDPMRLVRLGTTEFDVSVSLVVVTLLLRGEPRLSSANVYWHVPDFWGGNI